MLESACPRCGVKLVREDERCPACASAVADGGLTAATVGGAAPLPEPAARLLAPPGYEVLAELGRGGMGVVYKARQVALRREVALKMVLAGVHAGAAERARFRTEAESLARLRHPGIVAIYEVGEHADHPFLCMEYCPGGSLDRRLAGAPLLPRLAAALVQKLARATEAAHEAKVIHRDLKPANVLLGADGEPRLTDFGLARQLDDQGQTQTGTIMGSPSYMAPEQARGEKAITPLADVYALGAVLYECLTGRPPFRAATTFDTLAQVLHDEPVAPTTLNAQVPRDLETICLKCLRKEPARRYGSAQALAEDLGRWLGGEPIAARPVGRLERAAKWVRRNPAVAALSATTALLLAAGMAASALLALEARREADRANQKAEEADRERGLAEAARQEAEREKAAAQRALAEVERTLLEGLLRPIGKSGISPSAAELEALERLASLSDGRRVRFVEMALETAESARRLTQRAEWVAQAAVGVDRARRRRVVALIQQRCRQPDVPREVLVAGAVLAAHLDEGDARLLLDGLAALAPMYRDAHGEGAAALKVGLDAVLARLGGDEVGRAADVMLRAAEPLEPPWDDVATTLPSLEDVLRRLPAERAAPRARRAADAVSARLAVEASREKLFSQTSRLRGLLALLPAAEAASRADRLAARFGALLLRGDGGGPLYYLCIALEALAPSLSPAGRRQAAEACLTAMRRFPENSDYDSLVALLDRLLGQMSPPDRRAAAAQAADLFLEALQKGGEAPGARLLAGGLAKAARHRGPDSRGAGVVLALLAKSAHIDQFGLLTEALMDLSPAASSAGHAGQAARHLLGAMARAPRLGDGHSLVASFRHLAGKLDRATARRAAEALLAAAGRGPAAARPTHVLTALGAVGRRLPAGEAARFAGRAAELAVAAAGRGDGELDVVVEVLADLRPLFAPGQETLYAPAVMRALLRGLPQLARWQIANRARSIKSLAPGLGHAEAARAAAEVLAFLKRQPDGDDVLWLSEALLALHGRLAPAEAARRTAELGPVLTAALARSPSHSDGKYLARAIQQLTAALPPGDAARLARQARAALLARLPQLMSGGEGTYFEPASHVPGGGLTLLLSWLDTEELVGLLEHPLLGRGVRQSVLNAMSLRTRVTFRNPHHVLSWAEANGVDLRPAGR